MADNNLDALVYVYTTIPAPLVYPSRVAAVYDPRVEPRVLKAGTKMSDPDLVPGEPSLKTDLDTWRSAGGSFAVNLSPASGLPAIVVPAGFTRVVYDRVPDASDPNGSRLDGPKADQVPVAMEFLGRPFDEACCSRSPRPTRPAPSTAGRRRDSVRWQASLDAGRAEVGN